MNDPALFFPKALNINLVWQVFWLIPVFWSLPILSTLDSGRYFTKPSSRITRDRASQQRVLLRIQTAFPFHYND